MRSPPSSRASGTADLSPPRTTREPDRSPGRCADRTTAPRDQPEEAQRYASTPASPTPESASRVKGHKCLSDRHMHAPAGHLVRPSPARHHRSSRRRSILASWSPRTGDALAADPSCRYEPPARSGRRPGGLGTFAPTGTNPGPATTSPMAPPDRSGARHRPRCARVLNVPHERCRRLRSRRRPHNG